MEGLFGEYPIMIGGKESGKLTVSSAGLMTGFEGSCFDGGELVRLSVYGEGVEGYLGVMLPKAGQLRISKKLSRAALENFPNRIEYAGISASTGAGIAVDEPSMRAQLTLSAELEAEADAAGAAAVDEISAAEFVAGEGVERDVFWIPEPNPWSLFKAPEMKDAWKNIEKALKSDENGIGLLALPIDEAEKLKGVYITASGKREIEGGEYIIFKIDGGSIIQ